MKFLIVFAASFAALVSAQGSAQDAPLLFHCQDSYVVPANRDNTLDQLKGWCDAKNTIGKNKYVEFTNGNTTAFFCNYHSSNKGCTSKEFNQFYGGMKAFCPREDQGASVYDQANNTVYGYKTNDKNKVCFGFEKAN